MFYCKPLFFTPTLQLRMFRPEGCCALQLPSWVLSERNTALICIKIKIVQKIWRHLKMKNCWNFFWMLFSYLSSYDAQSVRKVQVYSYFMDACLTKWAIWPEVCISSCSDEYFSSSRDPPPPHPLFSPKNLKSMREQLRLGNLMDTFQQRSIYCRLQCSLNWSNRASCQTIMRVKSFRARSWRDGQTKDNQYHMMCGLESRLAPCRHNHHMPLSACLPPYSMSDTMSNSQHVGRRVN